MRRALTTPTPLQAPLDWATFGAILLLVLVSAYGLAAADWSDHLDMVPTAAVLGVVAGTALARSRFPGWLAAMFAVAYGLFLVTFLSANTIVDVFGIHDRLAALAGRLSAFAVVLATAEPNYDPLMFVLLMLALYWSMGALAGYAAFRRDRIWPALILPGVALLVNTFYYLRRPGLDGYVAAFAMTAVGLLFVVSLDRRRRDWRGAGSRVPSNASGQITQVGLLLAFLVVTLAWGVPSFAKSERAADLWTSATRPWVRLRYRLTQAFTGLRNPVAIVSDVFGDQLRLAAAVTPAETPIFSATVVNGSADGLRLYWRARTYDTYAAGTWTSSETDLEPYFPDEGSFPLPDYSGRQSVEITVEPQVDALHLLYVPPQPSGINRSSLLTVVRTPGGLADVSSVAARTTVVRGEVYRVRSEVASPTAAQLRSAGTDYPEWVQSRFLQLPETLTPRTRQLAVEIAIGLDTPYDQAAAITRWLRANIEYTLESGEPPEGVEPIDWFLFDHGVGFCNWYASAEVPVAALAGDPGSRRRRFRTGDARRERVCVPGASARCARVAGGLLPGLRMGRVRADLSAAAARARRGGRALRGRHRRECRRRAVFRGRRPRPAPPAGRPDRRRGGGWSGYPGESPLPDAMAGDGRRPGAPGAGLAAARSGRPTFDPGRDDAVADPPRRAAAATVWHATTRRP